MPSRFVSIDRLTPLLFPPDLRDWVEKDDLVHFVLDAVDSLPLRNLQVNRRGSGSEQYPPRMLLALTIYCYATGTFSSRGIERLTYSSVSVRFICANTHPDHDTICTFRRRNKALLEEMFVSVLELAAELKFSKIGTVAIDGTKIAANASKHAAVSYGRAGELIERLQLEVEALLAKAEDADSVPLLDGLTMPTEITRREDRQEKLREAREAIEARFATKHEAEQAEYERKIAVREARVAAGKKGGRIPKAPPTEVDAKLQYNFTDPQSRIMKAGSGKHFEQAYNAQAAVETKTMLVVGQHVTDAPNDKEQLQPTLASIPAVLGRPAQVIVDSGFFSAAQIIAVEGDSANVEKTDGVIGPDVKPGEENPTEIVLTATVDSEPNKASKTDDSPGVNPPQTSGKSGPIVYAAVGREKHNQPLASIEKRPDPDPPPDDAGVKEKMKHRLQTAHGRAVYKQRKQTVEPVFGIIKEVLGFRRFSMRGLEKANLEWTLVCLAWNMKRLHKLGMHPKMLPAA